MVNSNNYDDQPLLDCEAFESLFADLFAESEKTLLRPTDGEPLYVPVSEERDFAEVRYVQGSLPSALHEVAHWCLAGKERRKLVDYGYWYKPDGRTADEQSAFESVESKPQAVEWLLSTAIGRRFVVSCDNLKDAPFDTAGFQQKILERALRYWQKPPSTRTTKLISICFERLGTRNDVERFWDRQMHAQELPQLY